MALADNANLPDYGDILTNIIIGFSSGQSNLQDFTVKEIMLGESLLTPGLQTSIKVHSYLHNVPNKDFDLFKGSSVGIELERKVLENYGIQSKMDINQVVYRLDSRRLINNQTEEFMIRACDQTLLNDAETLVSKSWKCKTPSQITEFVLRSCVGAERIDVEDSGPDRDYIAENIHPFQVINQQTNYALTKDGYDPSFVHYMTYQNLGTHHFRSIKSLAAQSPTMKYYYNDTGAVYPSPSSIMTYSFPCDFDLLSDVLNGIDTSGRPLTSVALFDPNLKQFSLMGNNDFGCGLGAGVFRYAISNQNSAKNTDACPDYAKEYLRLRQARMGLLEKDKIALRLTVPFNPQLNVGKTIEVNLYNKELVADGALAEANLYGSGKYLILHMYHHILEGGFSTTTMDCVASTVGNGEV